VGKSTGEPAVAPVLHGAQQREMRGGLWPDGAWRGEIGGKGKEDASLWAPEHVRGVYLKMSFGGEDTGSGKQFFCKFNKSVYIRAREGP
jgi:hypothetical protein